LGSINEAIRGRPSRYLRNVLFHPSETPPDDSFGLINP
jgi:hypothetical protein